jgi:two-component system, cell cycle response regulator DivK
MKAGAPQAAPNGKPEMVEPPLILIVDDYEDARDMCSLLLQYHGFRTETATTGWEALDKAHQLMPAVILMDLSLPGMDGWEATRRLKADAKTRAIPVVAVTGHAMAGHSENAREAGCDFFLTKPVLPDTLIDQVRRIVSSPAHPPGEERGGASGRARRHQWRSNGSSPPERRK